MQQRIVVNPEVCGGQPTIAGTRIAASTVLGFLSAGDSVDDILAEYPTLTREDVLACIAYSAKLLETHYTVQDVA